MNTDASAREDERCSVTVVHVAIDDGGAVDAPVALQPADRDGDVIEQAESLAVIGKRMMQAAAEMHGDA